MTREEFSAILAEHRKQKKVMLREMCYKIGCLDREIYRIERGQFAYNMNKCFQYMDAIGVHIEIKKGSCIASISSTDIVMEALKKLDKKSPMSLRGRASDIGISYGALCSYKKQTSVMSIDVFLKLIDYLGFTLKIVPND